MTKEYYEKLDSNFIDLETEYLDFVDSHAQDSVIWDSFKYRLISYHVQLDLLLDEIKYP